MRKMMMFALSVVLLSALAGATTVADYEKMPAQARVELLTNFIDKMTNDIREKDPQLAQNIRAWFIEKQEGKPLSAGMERLTVELNAIDIQAKDGKLDPAKIQIEAVVVHLVKQKFAPARQS